jgi:hypothetical protein
LWLTPTEATSIAHEFVYPRALCWSCAEALRVLDPEIISVLNRYRTLQSLTCLGQRDQSITRRQNAVNGQFNVYIRHTASLRHDTDEQCWWCERAPLEWRGWSPERRGMAIPETVQEGAQTLTEMPRRPSSISDTPVADALREHNTFVPLLMNNEGATLQEGAQTLNPFDAEEEGEDDDGGL